MEADTDFRKKNLDLWPVQQLRTSTYIPTKFTGILLCRDEEERDHRIGSGTG
jgi:hypothetical protein